MHYLNMERVDRYCTKFHRRVGSLKAERLGEKWIPISQYIPSIDCIVKVQLLTNMQHVTVLKNIDTSTNSHYFPHNNISYRTGPIEICKGLIPKIYFMPERVLVYRRTIWQTSYWLGSYTLDQLYIIQAIRIILFAISLAIQTFRL